MVRPCGAVLCLVWPVVWQATLRLTGDELPYCCDSQIHHNHTDEPKLNVIVGSIFSKKVSPSTFFEIFGIQTRLWENDSLQMSSKLLFRCQQAALLINLRE